MMQTTPSTMPFVEYVLKVIEHPPHMFVSKLAACCTTLFLTRSDPHLLRSLCHKWAIRFSMDRRKLIRYIKERSRKAPGQPDYRSGSDTDSSSASSSDEDTDDFSAEVAGDGAPKKLDCTKEMRSTGRLKFCDPERAEEHFLSILNSLVPLYFSWNWHKTEQVIKMNKEHELYIRENILPICIAVPAEDGVDDDEALPWLCPPRSFLRGYSQLGAPGSPTQSVSQFFSEAANGNIDAGHSRPSEDGTSASPARSPTAPDASALAIAAAQNHGLVPHNTGISTERSVHLLSSPASRCRQGSTTYMTPVPNARGVSACTGTGAPAAALTLMTLSNYKTVLTSSPHGTVMIFHAEYSMKSNDVLQLIQDVVQKRLLDPMPTVAVVYTVTEPELSTLYDIKWIPTIVYTPPTTESAFDTATKSLHSTDRDSINAKGEAQSPNSGAALAHLGSSQLAVTDKSLRGRPAADGTSLSGHESASTTPSNAASTGRATTQGLSQTLARSGSVDGMLSTRSVSATTNAATTAAAQLLYGLDLDRRRRKQGGSTPSEGPFASPVSNSGRSFDVVRLVPPTEPSLATPTSAPESLDHTCHDSIAGISTPVDELVSFVESDDHRVYPVNGLTTSAALIEWINSRGTAAPRLKKAKEFVTRVSAIRTEQKYKQFRELHSAVIMLRRLQSNEVSPSAGAAHNGPPLFIFLGGGMAAGKSTAAMALAHSPWWRHHKDSSVLVNADEFKVADPLYETQHPDVHSRSTRAAENLLVQAVNQGRSIVFDGTMMWKPFVEQVVSMVRHAHTTLYRQGPGYVPEKNIEEYFQVSKTRPSPLAAPYKIVLLGITVEPEIAVPRGFLRKFSTGRGVPISTQLESFKLFAQNFDDYVALVDRATLYNNNVFVDLSKGELPPVLAEVRDEEPRKLHVFDEAAYQLFLKQRTVNTDADNILELYPNATSRNASTF